MNKVQKKEKIKKLLNSTDGKPLVMIGYDEKEGIVTAEGKTISQEEWEIIQHPHKMLIQYVDSDGNGNPAKIENEKI